MYVCVCVCVRSPRVGKVARLHSISESEVKKKIMIIEEKKSTLAPDVSGHS